jgi:hypothetical protein
MDERLGPFELVLQPGPDTAFPRPPSGSDSGPSIRIQPFGRTCQSLTVPSPSTTPRYVVPPWRGL